MTPRPGHAVEVGERGEVVGVLEAAVEQALGETDDVPPLHGVLVP